MRKRKDQRPGSDVSPPVAPDETAAETTDLFAAETTEVFPAETTDVSATPEVIPDADEAGLAGGLPEAVVGDDDVTNRVELAGVDPVAVEAGLDEPLPVVEGSRLESILESLLFAADRPLVLTDLKRLLGDRDVKRLTAALENLRERRADSGIQLVSVAGGWQLRTHPENGAWVAKLVAGRPPRLSRAMMETLSIIAYRQPITRPEIDEIRGVDCGPVLRTLLDRALIRVLGKREEVGRPILYGTTPEFLKTFSLRDLTDLPTLREFHELGADDRAKVDAQTGDAASDAGPVVVADLVGAGELPDMDPEEEDRLIDALDQATNAAGHATRSATEPQVGASQGEGEGEGDAASAATSTERGEP